MISRAYYAIVDNKQTVAKWSAPILLLVLALFMVARAISDDEMQEEARRTLSGKAQRVYSGHKIKLEKDDEKIRLAGIRAPYPGEPFYEESRDRLGYLVLGHRLRLRFDVVDKDRKDRTMAYVFYNGVNINVEMVRQGLAYVRLTPDTLRYAEELLAAQKEAQRKQIGIWAGMNWDTADSYPADPKYGSFHLPTCEEVDKINPARLVIYRKKRDAFDFGLAPCSKCLP